MDFKDIQTTIQRFNDAIYEIAIAEKHERVDDVIKMESHTRNAISSIYQSLEWGLKYVINTTYFGTGKNTLLGLSDLSKLLDEIETRNLLVISSINTQILKDTKRLHRNPHEHKGEKPNLHETKQAIEEVRKIIKLIDNEVELKTIEQYDNIISLSWDNFYSVCDKFNPEERNYILLIGNNENVDKDYLVNLGVPKWDAIFDFDYNSISNGFYKEVFSETIPQPTKINITEAVDNEMFTTYKQSHYHYFINSYLGSGTSAIDNYDSWNRQYSSKIDKFIKEFSSKYSTQKTIVVIIHNQRRHINFLCETFKKYFADKVSFVFALPNFDSLETVIEDSDGIKVEISIPEIAQGIANFSSNFGVKNPYQDKYVMPFAEHSVTEGATGILTPEFYAQLENDFEVVHKGLDTYHPEEEVDKREFLCGFSPISWVGLRNDWDRKHPSLKKHIKRVEDALSNAKGKIELVHEAGYGGSTIARRIAWHIHSDYPTLILKEYRENRTVQKLIQLHQITRKTIFVVMEVPQSISLDDVETFYRLVSGGSGTRPIVFLVVRRGNTNSVNLSDWGNNTFDLVNAYKPYLKEYNNPTIENEKERELNEISNGIEAYKKTPFYVGLVTFEEQFFAIKEFIKKFIDDIQTEEQKKIILYLAIVHDYLGEKLPASFFSNILRETRRDTIVQLEQYLPISFNSLIVPFTEGNQKYWQPRHALFSKELKEQILRGANSDNQDLWKQGLADICIKFIEESVTEEQVSDAIQKILQNLFIGTRKDRAGKAFTPIVDDIKIDDDKERLFKCLKETYSNNPHFCSHLARFYAYHRRNREKAFQYADEAIRLSESEGHQDPLLYHIKGMCLREAAYDLMQDLENSKKRGGNLLPEKINEVLYKLVPQAEKEFELSRKISREQNKTDEHGYIAHIQLLIRAIDFGSIISGKSKSEFLAENKDPFQDWIDIVEMLLEEVRRISIDEDESGKITDCEDSINGFYEKYEMILQSLNSQLEKGKNPSKVRRQIVRTYFRKEDKNIQKNNKTLKRILELMEENISEEPANEKNFFLWFQAARFSNVNLADALSKIGKWKAQSTALDATYYFYILKVFSALEGYSTDAFDAEQLIKECKKKAPRSQNITSCNEWYGKGNDLQKLVNKKDFDTINKENKLELVRGYFTDFENIGVGYITIVDKLKVFFSPAQAKLTQEDKNKEVEFYLGFSYDGLRADSYSVRLAGSKPRNPEHLVSYSPISDLDKNKVLESIKPEEITENTRKLKGLTIINKIQVNEDKVKQVSDANKGVVIELKYPPQYSMGFIKSENGKSYFFHKNNEKIEIFNKLKIGSNVTFEIGHGDKGEIAINLNVINE